MQKIKYMENQEENILSKSKKYSASLTEKYNCELLDYKDSEIAFYPQFKFENNVMVTFRIKTEDVSASDIVITNMTVLPHTEIGNGYGSKALQMVLEWAKEQSIHEIHATQVSEVNDRFWTKNGFVFVEGENPTRDFILRLD